MCLCNQRQKIEPKKKIINTTIGKNIKTLKNIVKKIIIK